MLKLENNKSIIFKEFCYRNSDDNFISYYVDFSGEAEQKAREKFYQIDVFLQDIYEIQDKLKKQQSRLLCHIYSFFFFLCLLQIDHQNKKNWIFLF